MVKNLQSHGIFLGKSWKNRSKIMAFNNVSKSSIKESHAMPAVFIRDRNAMKIRKKLSNCKKVIWKVMSSYKLISRWALALNAAVNWRARLASETLHCADFVHNPPIITAMTRNLAIAENHGTCPKSRYSWWLRIRDFLASLRMKYNNNNNNDRLTAFDPGQPG